MNKKEINEYIELLNVYAKLLYNIEIINHTIVHKKFIKLEIIKGNIGKYYTISITDAYTQLVGLRRFSKILNICSIF